MDKADPFVLDCARPVAHMAVYHASPDAGQVVAHHQQRRVSRQQGLGRGHCCGRSEAAQQRHRRPVANRRHRTGAIRIHHQSHPC